MCGLVYAHSNTGTPVNNWVANAYDKQKTRGTQGFGFYDGEHDHLIKSTAEGNILKALLKPQNASNMVLFHHRFPTSTENVRAAAHPFATKGYFRKPGHDREYVLIHNGHISNASELFTEHQALGIEYSSLLPDLKFNDSEALLWDFALYMEGKKEKVEARGGIAFICVQLDDGVPTKLHFSRNSNPLIMQRDKDGLTLSSEGEGQLVESGKLFSYNYAAKRLTSKELILTSYVYNAPARRSAYSGEYWNDDDDYQPLHNWDKQWDHDTQSYRPRSTTRADQKVGDWVSAELRKKFGVIQQEKRTTKPITDWVWDSEKKEMVQVEAEVTTLELSFLDGALPERTELEDEVLQKYSPSAPEIQALALRYLIKANGVFNKAFNQLEKDYSDHFAKRRTETNIKCEILMEKAMQWIGSDAEFISDVSVSSMWRNITNQQKGNEHALNNEHALSV